MEKSWGVLKKRPVLLLEYPKIPYKYLVLLLEPPSSPLHDMPHGTNVNLTNIYR